MSNHTQNPISGWHVLLSLSTFVTLCLFGFFSWWNVVRPISIKESCTAQNSSFYATQIQPIQVVSGYTLYGGVTIWQKATDNQVEIEAKDAYFSCLRTKGIN